jgi:hypothetical protein
MKRIEVLPLVLADLQARIQKGTAEYGEPLTTHNGRDSLQDAYEEALDLCLYLAGTMKPFYKASVLTSYRLHTV